MTFISITDDGRYRVRSPRVWLKINGKMLPCLTASVTRKSERKADTFSAELSVDETAEAGFGYPEWSDYQPVDVEILIAENAGDSPTSVITGQIDEPEINWENCTVTVSGRDKGAPLKEKRRSQQFKNQQSGDIVSTIAQDHGLTPQISAGGDFAGKLYDMDTAHLVLNVPDHEILNRLADREGFRWYVDGLNLVFEPRGTDTSAVNVEWVPADGKGRTGYATCTNLKTHRNMTAAKPHSVTVRSFHHKDKKHYDGKAQSDGNGDTVEVEHHHNGRNQAQVDKISKSRLKDAIRHDCNVILKMAGDITVTPRKKLNLTGTGTIYDQLYDIDSVGFEIAWDSGFDMTIAGKIAKSGRSGTDNTGATKNTAPASSTTPLPPERPPGLGTNSNVTPLTTPAGAGGIGSA